MQYDLFAAYAKIFCTRGSDYVDPAPTSESKLALFGDSNYMNAGGTAKLTSPSKVRIFNVRIYEDGVLVHRYEPYADAGCVGFRDLADGNRFFGIAESDANPLVPGGDIEYGAEADAFIESDGTQAIATDFLPTTNARVEIDFQMAEPPVKDRFLFGRWQDGDAPVWAFYVNWAVKFATRSYSAYSMELMSADRARHTAILDRKNGKDYITVGNVTNVSTAAIASSNTSDLPLAIFARTQRDGTYFGMTKMRIRGEKAVDIIILRLTFSAPPDAVCAIHPHADCGMVRKFVLKNREWCRNRI